ncbi:hypothetical protein INT46_010270 [Mucor plumbeus]|uniref:Histone H1 n=1 Tax=Mucor plumbeus TaxID=97098 RepID=A0A8H7QVJ0_9FUNG|nr:hypothetical protein INT46_010270 [Mucor plumbeus]
MANTETKTKPKKLTEHPTYENMIIAAVSNLKERKGSSRPAIKKYVLANYKVSPGAHFDSQISGAIRRGVAKDVFSLPKGLSGTIKLVKPEKKVKSSTTSDKKTDAKKETSEKKASSTTTTKKTESAKKTTKSPVKKVVKKKTAATKA